MPKHDMRKVPRNEAVARLAAMLRDRDDGKADTDLTAIIAEALLVLASMPPNRKLLCR